MGFETLSILRDAYKIYLFWSSPYEIWNPWIPKVTPSVTNFEAVPMGFETTLSIVKFLYLISFWSSPYGIWNALVGGSLSILLLYFEAVPMGFET